MTARASLLRSLPPVYAAAAVRVALPLVALPVLAGRLGPEEFGRLGLCLVWAGLISLLVEGGFTAAVTRHAVVATAEARSELARRVFSARLLLSVPAVVGAAAVGACLIGADLLTPDRVELAALLAALSCVFGWPANWYLQATFQLHRWALVELGVHGVVLLVALTSINSVSAYLLLLCVAHLTLAILGWAWLCRDLSITKTGQLWSIREVAPGLRMGATMLPASLLGAGYTLALPAIAATQLGRAELGLYYLADRIIRALVSATDPLMQLVYPRIVDRLGSGLRSSLAYACAWSVAGWVAGGLIGLGVWLAWPSLHGLIGSGVDGDRMRSVIAVLAGLIPTLMGWRFVGYWMLGSRRYDRAYLLCVVVGAVVGSGGAWVYGQSAVELAVVALLAEWAVMLAAAIGILVTERLRPRGHAGGGHGH